MAYSLYYQAEVDRAKTWFVVAVLRSMDHVAFDRTLDAERCLFEFYVSPSTHHSFLEIMDYFGNQGLITHLQQLPNRLLTEELY